MKKIIVTRENYEEVMFNLLEDVYPADIRENLLDQVQADTFLSFEWQQWSKAIYSESTETIKAQEAEFIEGLTKEEDKKRGFIYYIVPLAVAASLAVFFVVFRKQDNDQDPGKGIVKTEMPQVKTEKKDSPVIENHIISENKEQEDMLVQHDVKLIKPDTITVKNELVPEIKIHEGPRVAEQVKQEVKSPTFNDTIRQMIAYAQKRPRYKVTIVEGEADALVTKSESLVEKRYSMADVLNHKDGITLSKFLQNSSSRIVNDKTTNKVTIEYVAEDHSVLVLTLSN